MLLCGPACASVFTDNLIANGTRKLWTDNVIFCGHFASNAQSFPKSTVRHEKRLQPYLRQIQGSPALVSLAELRR
jgi:hypothetical protein